MANFQARPAVLLLNFGEPTGADPSAVTRFLERIFLANARLEPYTDMAAARTRSRELARRRTPGLLEVYDRIGGSPLDRQAKAQGAALDQALKTRGHPMSVTVGMQFTEPSIEEALRRLRETGAAAVVPLPVYPLCGPSTTVAALDEVERALERIGWRPEVHGVTGWHRHPRYARLRADAIRRAGGIMVSVPTNREDSFNLEAEAVEAAITPASKALLIVTPSNPTAGIVTEDRLRAIADVCIRHNLIVIVDEIYGKIVFPPWRHFSIGSLPGMAERTITLDAFSKTYAMTGWRCGYVAAPVDVIEAMARIKQVTTGPVATVSQWAGLAAISGPQDCVADYLKIYTERRGALLDGLDRMGFAYGEPRGGLFVWADCSSTGIHATELSYLLLKEGRVLIFPGTAFGDAWREYLRITMLEPIETLKTAVARMLPVLERYRL